MRAMVRLGLNCGFGCTECARLKWTHVDSEHHRVKLARDKTGVPRNLPLRPEMIRALDAVPRSGLPVFYQFKPSESGHPDGTCPDGCLGICCSRMKSSHSC